MKLSYDAETDSLYIHLSEIPSVDYDELADGGRAGFFRRWRIGRH